MNDKIEYKPVTNGLSNKSVINASMNPQCCAYPDGIPYLSNPIRLVCVMPSCNIFQSFTGLGSFKNHFNSEFTTILIKNP